MYCKKRYLFENQSFCDLRFQIIPSAHLIWWDLILLNLILIWQLFTSMFEVTLLLLVFFNSMMSIAFNRNVRIRMLVQLYI